MKRRIILLAVLITFMYSTHISALTFYIWKDADDVVHIEDVRPEGTTTFEKIEIKDYSMDAPASESTGTKNAGAGATAPREKEDPGEKNVISSFAESFIEFFRIPERDREKDNVTTTQQNLDKYLKGDAPSPAAKKE